VTGAGAGPRVVALGGGHGLAASLSALRSVTRAVTAVVTVADDGGSSGRLREEIGALPPGDLRMALATLAARTGREAVWATLLQHRFGGEGSLSGHPVGNLLITGLHQTLGDPVAALDAVARLVGVARPARVLPVSCQPMDLVAEVVGLDPEPTRSLTVRGQVAIATTRGQVVGVSTVPTDPVACPEAVAAVAEADWVILGPGSWFTSVLPHLLVPELAKALAATAARRLVVLNLAPQSGETSDFSPVDHLEVLAAHAPDLSVDVVLADSAVSGPEALRVAAEALGARLTLAPVAADDGTPRHAPARLATAYAEIFSTPMSCDPGVPAWR
jgi:uncharacterized cofD-like protein